MKTVSRFVLVALLGVGAFAAHAEPSPTAAPFAVFVDRPTGFAFINTSEGWKYIRTLTPAQMKQLHPSTLYAVGPRAEGRAAPRTQLAAAR